MCISSINSILFVIICHVNRRYSYHTNSLDMVPRFDSASVTPLDQSHDDTNEEEHLSLLHTSERKMLVKITRLLFRCVYCNCSFIFEFIPCEVETLVSQKTQRELQTGEQEEVAEINQSQNLKFPHSCKDIPTFYLCAKVQSCFINGSNGCKLLPACAVLTFF